MRLEASHYVAINYMAQPKNGGLTLEEIAAEAKVSVRTIHNWKNNPVFEKELKRTIIRHTHKRLPEIMNSMVNAAMEDRNAAMFKLILQMNDMLPSASNSVDDRLDTQSDSEGVDAMQKRIQEYKERGMVQDTPHSTQQGKAQHVRGSKEQGNVAPMGKLVSS